MAVLTLPKEFAESEADRLVKAGVLGLWNFTGKELVYPDERAVVENVHLGDSLMILNYDICRVKSERQRSAKGDAQSKEDA